MLTSATTEVEVKNVIMLLVATALAAAGVVGSVLTLRGDGYRRIPTELRF